ncbi:RagB/SusD family nutrient uptake outer membrane protein [Zobellia galactanivorans]|uniref:SusD/RagB family lipoprotein n=1 Tax=Zobellia galactanivorans (strain DSM 12802 / CCUG 47099 / CIP 106680 / NCIMB 13871 / Dsij) TaxID=63186 RepID=G0KZY5_ZOBGA|nr:RagB/SusD family nutrient uptake outer membrane protein [Zobellia galactanivorans]MBU3025293.1 RagB/SusD family nutrient uptake outer membrane protein [Zobellia galactanivorans]MDO6810700.1 RagB/SusD family nutrient uptake outer membrane protein [Zobellia galactanivorans]CAZ97259.1 SusD/RagB family lipoprotein [Zobellia galactanivorans]
MNKELYKYRKTLLGLTFVFALAFISCEEEFLDAEPQSFFTPGNALNTPDGLSSLNNNALARLTSEFYGDGAPIITENIFSEVAVEGTTDKSGPAQDLNLLILPDANLNSSDSNRIGWFWNLFYEGIKFNNTVIGRIDDAEFESNEQRDEILGKAYFLRAYFYYRLTQQFGDIPFVQEEVKTPKLDFVSTSRTTILEKMRDDLNAAVSMVPEVSNKGDVNKAAVLHLLTKVNLALADFDAAITSASQVIDGGQFKLMTDRFGSTAGDATKDVTWDLHRPQNKSIPGNTEGILMSISRLEFEDNGSRAATTVQRQAVPLWWRFINTPDGQNGMSDAPDAEINQVFEYGRGIGRNRGTAYSTEQIWKDANSDQRFKDGNWVQMEDLVYNAPSLKEAGNSYYGKNLELYLPDGTALCSDTIRNWYDFPHYKFSIPDPLNVKPQGGHSDWYVFRIAETHLLRAEAYFWKGNLAEAANDINAVRRRAEADDIAATDVNIDVILDERARELYYEEPRKTELTRIAYIFAMTGKTAYNGESYSMDNFSQKNFWYDRIMEVTDFYNKGVKTIHGDEYTMSPYHVLWPVPSSAINANTQGRINQNEGYPGAELNVAPLTSIPEAESGS